MCLLGGKVHVHEAYNTQSLPLRTTSGAVVAPHMASIGRRKRGAMASPLFILGTIPMRMHTSISSRKVTTWHGGIVFGKTCHSIRQPCWTCYPRDPKERVLKGKISTLDVLLALIM